MAQQMSAKQMDRMAQFSGIAIGVVALILGAFVYHHVLQGVSDPLHLRHMLYGFALPSVAFAVILWFAFSKLLDRVSSNPIDQSTQEK